MRILIIDDDQDFADGLAEMLDVFGHETGTAYTANEGVGLAGDERFDLALIDIGLAGRNGADCARKIRETEPELTCVLMTGYSADALTKMGVSAADFAILRKPIKLEHLERYLAG